MMQASRRFRFFFTATILTVVTAYFLYLMIPWLGNDLFRDEYYTLVKFSLVPLLTSVADYSSTNHVLYDLCCNCYLKILGIHSIATILEQPCIVRLPMLLLALGTLLLIYRSAWLAGGRMAAIIAVAILATTIPFHDFCLQVRGYGFAIFFDLLIVYSCLLYLIKKKKSSLRLMAFAVFAAVYSVSSDLYCVVGILAFWCFESLYSSIRERQLRGVYRQPVVAVLAGIALALLCYLPVLREVFTNPYVSRKSAPFQLCNINDATFFYSELIEGRVVLFVLFALSAILYFLPSRPGTSVIPALWHMVCWQFISPVAMVVVLGQQPPARVFVYLYAMLALLIAVSLAHSIRQFATARLRSVIVSLLVLYLIAACESDRAAIDRLLSRNIRKGITAISLRANFYLYYYHPLLITHYLIAESKKDSAPIILKPEDMYYYLQGLGLPYHSRDSLDDYLRQGRRVLLVTTDPHRVDSAYMAAHHCTARELLSTSYHHLMEIRPR